MPVNQVTIPQPGTANYAPGPDGTPGPYQRDSTLVPNPAKADGELGTGSNSWFIPESTSVPNPVKADGAAGTGSNARFIPESTPVPNPAKADGQLGTGSNSRIIAGATDYVPNISAGM